MQKTSKFLLFAVATYRSSDYISLKFVGEFSSTEEANSAIITGVDEFNQAEDGGGTRFVRVKKEDYVKNGERYFVAPEAVLNCNFETPEEVKEKLEPF